MLQDTEQRFAPTVSTARDHLGAGRFIYRLEDIEIDCAQGCLKKAGKDQYIRQQSFQVLLYLIERRERLIGKEELIDAFWCHTAVTDNALVQCIADIRRALGDDSRHPRFIKTIPKVGYRFIGPLTVDHASPHDETLESLTAAKASATLSARSPHAAFHPNAQRLRIAIALGALTALFLLWYLLLHRSVAAHVEVTLPPLPGQKSLAVIYFDNQSKRPDLNWLREGLADMFIASLTESGKLTVLSRQQLQYLLERIGHNSTSDISLNEALDIARRSHADTLLLGSFASLGERLLVNVQLFDSSHARLLFADRFTVSRSADVLGQVDLLSLKVSSHLGIAPSNGARKASLADAMTNDFEAYRYYSLGVGKAQAFENAEAISLLQRAVQRDANFAMAYARIGYAYSVTDFLPEKGMPYLEKAFRLSDRLTEKDRLYVTAWYAIAGQDYATAIRTFQQLLAEYPLEIEAYARLARLLYREERSQEAISVIQQGLAADPDAGDLYNVLGICFLGLHKYDDAIAAHSRYLELSPKEPNAHDSLGMSYQQAGRYADAIAEYNSALLLNPKFEPAIIHLGDAYSQQGRYRDGIREYQRYIQVTRSNAARAVAYGSIAQVYRRKHDFQPAELAAQSETAFEPGAVWNSLIFALDRGDTAKVARLRERLFQKSPYPERGVRQELRSYDYYLGTLALKNDQLQEATADFKEALRHLPPSSGLDLYEDCLANAYLQSGQLDNAIKEYQRILSFNPNYPLAQYHLGLAYQRKGDSARARLAYTRFLNNWKDADPDIPEIIAAREAVRQMLTANPKRFGG